MRRALAVVDKGIVLRLYGWYALAKSVDNLVVQMHKSYNYFIHCII